MRSWCVPLIRKQHRERALDLELHASALSARQRNSTQGDVSDFTTLAHRFEHFNKLIAASKTDVDRLDESFTETNARSLSLPFSAPILRGMGKSAEEKDVCCHFFRSSGH